mmetsp:Transcript_13581/g.27652  ORF Transcript_13581/g.27652 Transcript_13581/m.27652 type:complete len:979 (+) Transcript_13581:182-3118(+)
MADSTRQPRHEDARRRPVPNDNDAYNYQSPRFPQMFSHQYPQGRGHGNLQNQLQQPPSNQYNIYGCPYQAPTITTQHYFNVGYHNSSTIALSNHAYSHNSMFPGSHQLSRAVLQNQVPENVIVGNNGSSWSVDSTLTSGISGQNTSQKSASLEKTQPLQNDVSTQQNFHQYQVPSIPPAQYQTAQSQHYQSQQQPAGSKRESSNRAIHRIHLPSIRHNYNVVQSAAAQQQCQVITVVKADGYGHGALFTACHLVEKCGADAFAVATLEEGVALRKALQENLYDKDGGTGASNNFSALPRRVRICVLGAPVGYPSCFDTYLHYDIEVMVSSQEVAASLARWMIDHEGRKRAEVERAAEQRKEQLLRMDGADQHPMRNRVVRQVQQENEEGEENKHDGKNPSMSSGTMQSKECNQTRTTSNTTSTMSANTQETQNHADTTAQKTILSKDAQVQRLQTKHNAATLTNVTGPDLAREVRQILIEQRHAAAATGVIAEANKPAVVPPTVAEGIPADIASSSSKQSTTPTPESNAINSEQIKSVVNSNAAVQTSASGLPPRPAPSVVLGAPFSGIEDAAKASRQRELRAIRRSQLQSDDSSLGSEDGKIATNNNSAVATPSQSRRSSALAANTGDPPLIRKKLRWHALVDSGMGRLGFKTEQLPTDRECGYPPLHSSALGTPNTKCAGVKNGMAGDGLSDRSVSSATSDQSIRSSSSPQPVVVRDTVSIIKELYDAEVHDGAAIEFYGMCTHMADANATSNYTNAQMERFRSLLYRVRSAGISVPTISTDNSAALLTTTLTHFDPQSILSHDTRGYVRTGGAIYGQRPSFNQLRAVSTLTATVKHVSIIQKGESVGYDRAYVAPTDVRIATLTIGFADGYPRELGNGVGRVSIRGATFPVAGNVCMDMMMVDLGASDNYDGIGAQVKVGDVAVLWGPEGTNDANVKESGNGLVPLAELASTLKTTQSALTCGLDKLRVQRQYVE